MLAILRQESTISVCKSSRCLLLELRALNFRRITYGKSEQPKIHCPKPGAASSDRIRRRALRSEKKVELPFVMGVMADLSGKPEEPLPSVDERKFLEIDVDNFDDRLKG